MFISKQYEMKLKTLILMLAICLPAIAQEQKEFRINKNLTIYNDVMRQLDLNYVDTLNYDQMVKTSIDAMLGKLDPYTVYLPEDKTEDLQFMTTGAYGGIGAVISQRNGKSYITDPYEGMPAQRNDVRAGDIILEIDGKSTKGKTLNEVSNMLRGKPHDKIRLKLERYGEKKPIIREFERETIQINPVGYAGIVANGTGYVQLNEFTDKAATEFKAAVNRMVKSDSISALVIDLRDNGGGIIDEAIKIVGYFVPKGTEVVSTKGKITSTERVYKTTTEPIYPDMKLAVLTNRASASASEIVAGAMQDLDRAVLIGERTFGKGLVQNIRPISYDGHLKITTAKYYIPSGRCIQAIDYSHRNEDGSVGRVPDSLTHVFHTKNGRIVRDGGGISPDIDIKPKEGINITYYIYIQNMHFDFATKYAAEHPTIAPPDKFSISQEDYKAFEDFLEEKKFHYTTETEKFYGQLLELASYEGLDSIARPEFEALKQKLTPDISQALVTYKDDITDLLNMEIIKRYYFQKGEVQYSLRHDKELQKAREILNDDTQLNELLGKKQ